MAGSRVREVVNAAVDALKVDTALLALTANTPTGTHVKQKTSPPYTVVMGGDELPWAITLDDGFDQGDSGGRQVDVLVQCVSIYPGSLEVDAMAGRVMEVLTDAAPWTAVPGFQLAEFIRNAAVPPADVVGDGVLWFVRWVSVRVFLV
jgi:hypothetical protein